MFPNFYIKAWQRTKVRRKKSNRIVSNLNEKQKKETSKTITVVIHSFRILLATRPRKISVKFTSIGFTYADTGWFCGHRFASYVSFTVTLVHARAFIFSSVQMEACAIFLRRGQQRRSTADSRRGIVMPRCISHTYT